MTQPMTRAVRSMTGQGHATGQGELGTVTVEVRTINNRGFKCSPRLSDSLSSLETKIEALARSLIHRGTVHLSVSWRRPAGENLPSIDGDVLRAYVDQLQQLHAEAGPSPTSIDLSTLMLLPGVIDPAREDRKDDDRLWDLVRDTIVKAIENLNQMRMAEGDRMAESLMADCHEVRTRLDSIAEVAPRVVDNYRNRLRDQDPAGLAGTRFGGPGGRSASRSSNLRRSRRYQRRDHAVGQPPEDVRERYRDGAGGSSRNRPAENSTSSSKRCFGRPIRSEARRPMRKSPPTWLKSNVRLNGCGNWSRISSSTGVTKGSDDRCSERPPDHHFRAQRCGEIDGGPRVDRTMRSALDPERVGHHPRPREAAKSTARTIFSSPTTNFCDGGRRVISWSARRFSGWDTGTEPSGNRLPLAWPRASGLFWRLTSREHWRSSSRTNLTRLRVFIHPGGMDELEDRLRARNTESEEAIAARLETASSEMRYMHRYQYEVINGSVDTAVAEICQILKDQKENHPCSKS